WTVLAWAPALLLLATIRTAVPDGSGPSVGWLRPLVDDPDLRRAVLHSALVGLLAGTTALVIARLSATPTAGRTGPRLAFGGRGVISGRVPSVIAGVGVLAIPALLRAAGRGLERALPSAGPGRAVAELAGAID